MSQILRKRPSPQPAIYKFTIFSPLLALLLSASGAFAAAPQVVVDAQLSPQTGLNGPQSIAVAPNNTYYVADAGNNRVQAYIASNPSTVNTGSFTLVNPQAVAVDSSGDLFIGDSPTSGVGRVIEAMATNGTLNGTVNLVVMGGALKDVTALTVDTNPSSSTFNTLYIGDDVSFSIYSVAAGSTTLVNLGITGLPSNILPSALAKDAAGNLYIADFFATLYRVPAGSTTASIYFIDSFTVNGPTGLALDPKGNLYVLTLTSSAPTPSQPVPENIIEIPGGDTASAFRIPFTTIQNGSGIGIDSLGNIYVVDFTNNAVTELVYGSPVPLFTSAVNTVGSPVSFNYEFNSATKARGFAFVSGGDKSTEIQDQGGTCLNANYNTGSDGGAISTIDPFVCQENFAPLPTFPGPRYGAIRLKTTGGAFLTTTQTLSVGLAGESVVYPLTSTAGATVPGPVGVAVSGLDKKIYITNSGPTAAVYSVTGPNGKTLTQISTAPVSMNRPYGITINGAGDLYIADFGATTGIGQIVVVPADGSTPFAFNPGNLLQHPLTVGFDSYGNLFIGDSGPNGVNSDQTTPGFLVEVPAGGGTPFKVNTGGVTIIYPWGIAVDPYSADVYVADGGDVNGVGAKVAHVVPNGGSTNVVNIPGVTQPVAIAFDPAEDYYVVDFNTADITEVPRTGVANAFVVPVSNASLAPAPASLAATPGAQNFMEVNFGTSTTSGNLVYLKGTTTTLNFGTIRVGQSSGTMTATLNSIGTLNMTLQTPYFTSSGDSSVFDFQNSTTCANALVLGPGSNCTVGIQFAPTGAGLATSTVTFQTDAFQPSSTILHLRGRGR